MPCSAGADANSVTSNQRAPRPELLDEVLIVELENLGGAILPDLLNLYFEEAGRQMSELGRAMDRGEMLAVSRGAHKLKGSSSTLGAVKVSYVAAQIEGTARAGDLSSAEELLERLHGAFDETREAFSRRGAERPAAQTHQAASP
jgi:HPt (histidine-containing phosphotransfer) domain-containing protein